MEMVMTVEFGRCLRLLFGACLLLSAAGPAMAQPPDGAEPTAGDYADGLMVLPPPVTEPDRWTRCNPAPALCDHPRVALVLSGGGALGIAHIGAIRTLERAGVQPDMLTVAKALGAGFPCSALMMTRAVAANLRHGDLGTTFGGGPLASALMSTVIEVIRRDRLIDNVQALSREIIDAMPLGPVEAVQGKGFLLGLRCRRPAKQLLEELLRRDILVGTSADPLVMRLLPPLTLERTHVHALLNALADIGPG